MMLPTLLLVPLLLIGSYLIGSIPFGLLVGRWCCGVDIREHGSGNIGATNAGRTLGKKWGVLILILDALKGMLPTLLLPMLLSHDAAGIRSHVQVGCGVATILGHMFPLWLKLRGGKGVATAMGVTIILAPWGVLTALVAFVLSMLIFRIVSLSSILASIAFALAALMLLMPAPFGRETWSLALFALLIPALIIVRHRGNIGRIRRGEEARFTFARKPGAKR